MELLGDWLAIDIETDGDPWSGKLVALGIDDGAGGTVYKGDEVPAWLWAVLADPDVGIIEHTLYDARWLSLAGHPVNHVVDTRVMAWNVDENQKLDLESLVFKYLGYKMDKRLRRVKGGVKFLTNDGELVPIADTPWDQMTKYNLDDVQTTVQLFEKLQPMQPNYWNKQIALTDVLLGMETAGLPVKEDQLEWTRESYEVTRKQVESALTEHLPPVFNLNSGDQVSAYLFLEEFELPGRLKKGEQIPPGFKFESEGRIWMHGRYKVRGLNLEPKGWTESESRPKCDAKTLSVHYGNVPWVAQYLEYQKLTKILGTYLGPLPKFIHGGRLYGTFNQAGTVSGRLSSSEPNMQNLPRRGKYGADIRALFGGPLVVADFSQLEPRLMAHWSEDPRMLEVYRQGKDIYKVTGMGVFDEEYFRVNDHQREISKVLVLGMGYGAQSRKVAEILAVSGFPTTQKEAQRYLDAMRATYPRFFEWREEVVALSRETGYVHTLAGRKRRIGYDDIDTSWKAERQAVNSVIQGSAADVVNETMLGVSQIPGVQILVQVHDELVCDVDLDNPPLKEIQYEGEQGHGFKLRVPLVFEPKLVEHWGEK